MDLTNLWIASCNEYVKTEQGTIVKSNSYLLKADDRAQAEALAAKIEGPDVDVRVSNFEQTLEAKIKKLDEYPAVYIHA